MKAVKNYLKHLIIYLMSFMINYLIFIVLMLFISYKNYIGIQIINVIAWLISMLFIFYVDQKYVPDLVDENNSKELFKFILVRILSLIIESIIIFVFIDIFQCNYYLIKLFSLVSLFILNSFYVKNIKFKD